MRIVGIAACLVLLFACHKPKDLAGRLPVE